MRILLFLLSSALSSTGKKPLVVVPGLFGNNLYVSSESSSLWYCPPKVDNQPILSSYRFYFPPFFRCIAEWVKVSFDESSSSFLDSEKTVSVHDFGGFSTLLGFEKFEKFFKDLGYIPGKDLFAAPEDWRFGFMGTISFWTNLKRLIEKSYQQNGEKSIIIGHSLGCGLIQRFINDYTDKEWRMKYIDSLIFVAPSWSGIGETLMEVIPMLSKIVSGLIPEMKEISDYLPFLHQHYPNPELLGNQTVLIDKDGVEHNSSSAIDYLLKGRKSAEYSAQLSRKVYDSVLRDSGVPVRILHSSQIPTIKGVDLRSSMPWNSIIMGKGDGLITSEAAQWGCRNLNVPNGGCIDAQKWGPEYSHAALVREPMALEQIALWANATKISSNSPYGDL